MALCNEWQVGGNGGSSPREYIGGLLDASASPSARSHPDVQAQVKSHRHGAT